MVPSLRRFHTSGGRINAKTIPKTANSYLSDLHDETPEKGYYVYLVYEAYFGKLNLFDVELGRETAIEENINSQLKNISSK